MRSGPSAAAWRSSSVRVSRIGARELQVVHDRAEVEAGPADQQRLRARARRSRAIACRAASWNRATENGSEGSATSIR